MTDKEKRILAYHEGGHALCRTSWARIEPQKVTIVARGTALGYVFHLPEEERYLETKEELLDWMVVALAGRAAEELVFGRVTNGAANDLEKVTDIARAMVFEWGMAESVTSRTMRADNYALSEETKRLRDSEQAQLTDNAYDEALLLLASTARRSIGSPRRCSRRRRSCATSWSSFRRRRAGVAGVRDRRRPARWRRPEQQLPRPSVRRRWPRAQIHHLGVAVDDLDAADRPVCALFGATLEHRERASRTRASRPLRCGRVLPRRAVAALGPDTPVGEVPREARPRHASRRFRGRRCRRRARRGLEADGAELIDRRRACGIFGLQVAFVHPESIGGVLAEFVADG